MKRIRSRVTGDPLKRRLRTIGLIVLPALILVFASVSKAGAQQPAPAAARQTQSTDADFGVGLGLCVSHRPEEADLIDAGGGEDIDKVDLFFDWRFFRLGFNMSNAQIKFSAYNKHWLAHLKKHTTYLVLRLAGESGQSPLEISAFAGVAYVDASFSFENQDPSSSSDVGYIIGGGALYNLGHVAVGPQVSIISAKGDFDGVEIATGGTQYLITMRYRF
jgi:hypothetical protein